MASHYPHTQDDGSGERPAARKRSLIPVWFFLLCVVLACGTDERSIKSARHEGCGAGTADGQRAGKAAGHAAVYEGAKGTGYGETLSQLYHSGDFNRIQSYTVAVVGVAFLLGFALQYAALYYLRQSRLLYDIDRIVLRKQATQVDLRDPAAIEGVTPAARKALAPFTDEETQGGRHD